ncbi:hypothetical protein C7U61_06075 [Rhizobium sp. JAB6]|nr:hypothetical protein C7U61_06075 [Rhizobium sp. JAB6]
MMAIAEFAESATPPSVAFATSPPQGGRLEARGALPPQTNPSPAAAKIVTVGWVKFWLRTTSPLVGEMSPSDRGGCARSAFTEASAP